MAVDIEALVGRDNMIAAAKPQVIEIIRLLQETPTTKRYLYGRWLRLVGFHPTAQALDAVALWGQH